MPSVSQDSLYEEYSVSALTIDQQRLEVIYHTINKNDIENLKIENCTLADNDLQALINCARQAQNLPSFSLNSIFSSENHHVHSRITDENFALILEWIQDGDTALRRLDLSNNHLTLQQKNQIKEAMSQRPEYFRPLSVKVDEDNFHSEDLKHLNRMISLS